MSRRASDDIDVAALLEVLRIPAHVAVRRLGVRSVVQAYPLREVLSAYQDQGTRNRCANCGASLGTEADDRNDLRTALCDVCMEAERDRYR